MSPFLVSVPTGDECGRWAGWVKGPGASAPRLASFLPRMITKGLSVRDRACKTWGEVGEVNRWIKLHMSVMQRGCSFNESRHP